MCDHTHTQRIYIRTVMDRSRTFPGAAKIKRKTERKKTIRTIFTMRDITIPSHRTIKIHNEGHNNTLAQSH